MASDNDGDQLALWPAAVAAVVSIALLFFHSIPLRLSAIPLFLAAGYTDYAVTTQQIPEIEGTHLITADVDDVRLANRSLASMTVIGIDGHPTAPVPVSAVCDGLASFSAGDRIRFHSDIISDNLSSIPDADTQREQKICFITESAIVACEPTPGMKGQFRRWRTTLLDNLCLSQLSPRSKEFLAAALLGEKSLLGEDTRNDFSRAGIAHVLSLSGLHVAIVAGLFYWLLAPLALFCHRHVRTVMLLAAVWIYACLTGLGAPVVRAAFMTSVVLLGDLLQRRTVPLNSLCAAALAILIFEPRQLSAPGFQLSFAAVGGIILLSESLTPFSGSRRLWRMIGEAFGVSMAAMLATGLVAALTFHSFPALFLVANILIVPVVVPAILTAGITVIAATATDLPCGLPTAVVDTLVNFTDRIAEIISTLPFAVIDTWTVSSVTTVLFIIFLSLVGLALWKPGRPERSLEIGSAIVGALTVLSAAVTTGTIPPDPQGTWYAAPVTSSTNILIPSGRSLFLVSDAPPTLRQNIRDYLDMRLSEYKGRRGIDSVAIAPSEMEVPGFSRHRDILNIGSTTIVLADGGRLPDVSPVDVAIITGSFRGDISSVTDTLKPERVMLSRALHPHLRRRYADSLRHRGIAYGMTP